MSVSSGLVALIFLAALQGVIGDAPFAGESLYGMQSHGGFLHEEPTLWAAIPQTSAKEWTNLRDVFTVETWFWWEGPLTNPFDYDLEHEYKPILARHPGMRQHNAWAHFHLELQYFPDRGAAVLAFAGCGCARLPEMYSTSTEIDSCGLGYLLRSDQGVTGPITYLSQRGWHHLAFVVDGDGGNMEATQTARLQINGIMVDNITWPLNEICAGRTIPWQDFGENYGMFDDIAIGYLSNDDVSPQGTNGRYDEVRIWSVPRTVEQIVNYHDKSLIGDEEGLVGYYTFNEGPQPGVQYFKNKVQLSQSECGEPVGYARPINTNRNIWALSTGLSIETRVKVMSTLMGEEMMPAEFVLLAVDPQGQGVNFFISEISPMLLQLILTGNAVLYDTATEGEVDISILPTLVSHELTISLTCVPDINGMCTNLGNSGDLALSYYGVAPNVPGNTAIVSIMYEAPCSDNVDACGVCAGDNSTCQCTSYHQIENSRMAYSLFTYTTSQMSPLVSLISQTLESSIELQPTQMASMDEELTNLFETGNIYHGCLDEFLCLMQDLRVEIEELNLAKKQVFDLEVSE